MMFFLLLILSATCSGCTPHNPRYRTAATLTPYEYQLNKHRGIKRKYRKLYAPKKSFKASIK